MANYLFPQGRVVSGDKTALEEVQKAAAAAGALKVQVRRECHGVTCRWHLTVPFLVDGGRQRRVPHQPHGSCCRGAEAGFGGGACRDASSPGPVFKSSCAMYEQQVTFNEPRMPVYSNVTGAPFEDAASIPGLLARQLVEPVKWEGSVQAMIGAGKTSLYELGPGAQIKAMIKRIDGNVWKTVVNVQP